MHETSTILPFSENPSRFDRRFEGIGEVPKDIIIYEPEVSSIKVSVVYVIQHIQPYQSRPPRV